MIDEKTCEQMHILAQLQEAEARKAHSEDRLVELMNRHGVDEAIRRACVERVGFSRVQRRRVKPMRTTSRCSAGRTTAG